MTAPDHMLNRSKTLHIRGHPHMNQGNGSPVLHVQTAQPEAWRLSLRLS
jgi:hypothetical protein